VLDNYIHFIIVSFEHNGGDEPYDCPDTLKYEAKKTTKTKLNDLFPLLGSYQTTLYNGNDRLAPQRFFLVKRTA